LPAITAQLREGVKLSILRSFGKLRRWVIGRFGVAVLSRTENGMLLAPADDLMVGRRLSFNGRYDPELLDFLLKRCEPHFHVLFVGAHVGALAIPVAKQVSKVTAVEANPETLELLRMNVLLNRLQNIEVHGFAASDRNGEARFIASRLNSGGSGLEIGERGRWAQPYDKAEAIVVQTNRLDDIFSGVCFDLIVMDIEGSEPLALRGMCGLLKRSRGLLVEVFEDHMRHVGNVSNEEFLSLVSPFFDEAVILTEKPREGERFSSTPYPKSMFQEMMLECCRRRMTNVMFSKALGAIAQSTKPRDTCTVAEAER